MVELFANSADPDQTPRSAASDLGLHCLPVTCLGVSSLQWVNSKVTFPYLRNVSDRMHTLPRYRLVHDLNKGELKYNTFMTIHLLFEKGSSLKGQKDRSCLPCKPFQLFTPLTCKIS